MNKTSRQGSLVTRDDEYAGVGLASKLGRGNLARAIAYVAVLGMVVPLIIGVIALAR